jgi:hypothetical protein
MLVRGADGTPRLSIPNVAAVAAEPGLVLAATPAHARAVGAATPRARRRVAPPTWSWHGRFGRSMVFPLQLRKVGRQGCP